MSLGSGLVEGARTWISLEAPKLESLPAASNVEVSRDGHDPISVSWILDGGGFMAQVVLWESGEFESDLADVETGQVQVRSGRITSTGELESLLGSARDWVVRSS